MTGMLDVDLCRARFPRVMNVEGKDNCTSVLLVGFQCTQTRTTEYHYQSTQTRIKWLADVPIGFLLRSRDIMLWCEDRGPKKNGVSDVRRELNLSECARRTKVDLLNYKCVFKRRRQGLSKELSDVPVLGSISKDLNLTQSLKEGQAFIDMESRQDSVSTDKHD
ncbi:hypothetical protein ACROYT_G024451 [Oculina patagonica]